MKASTHQGRAEGTPRAGRGGPRRWPLGAAAYGPRTRPANTGQAVWPRQRHRVYDQPAPRFPTAKPRRCEQRCSEPRVHLHTRRLICQAQAKGGGGPHLTRPCRPGRSALLVHPQRRLRLTAGAGSFQNLCALRQCWQAGALPLGRETDITHMAVTDGDRRKSTKQVT